MKTVEVRGARVLLPSEEGEPATSWPYPSPVVGETVSNTEFRSVDMASKGLWDVTISRCSFTGSRLIGVAMLGVTLKDVIFEGCQFGYAMWERVRTAEHVAFVDCSFRDAAFRDCDLRGAVFADCVLGVDLGTATKMSGADLRGSDLSGLSGIASLAGVRITEAQLHQVTAAMIADLDLAVETA